MPDGFDERATFIFEGVGEDELIGDFGLAGGGAAEYEIDRYELALGTPPEALLLASSEGHSKNYPHVVEEVLFPFPGLEPLARKGEAARFLPVASGGIAWRDVSQGKRGCGAPRRTPGP